MQKDMRIYLEIIGLDEFEKNIKDITILLNQVKEKIDIINNLKLDFKTEVKSEPEVVNK